MSRSPIAVRLARLALGLVATLLVATAARAAAPPRVESDDPGCVGKMRGEICRLPDGRGGVCGVAICPGDRACLHCMEAPPDAVEGPDGGLWIPMIAFGAVVCVVGFVFWFRLGKRLDG